MTKKILIAMLLLCAINAHATDYVFKMVITNQMFKGSYTGENVPDIDKAGRALIHVTEVQYGTGSQADFDALPQAVIDQAIDDANTAESDIDKWAAINKAFAKVVLDEINLLRVNAGLSERTLTQLKNAIKNKM